MSTKKRADILLHPLRLRIVLAVGSERLTTTDIGGRLPDVAPATLYRHIATLTSAGVLEVVDERRVRGGVQRTYALVPGAGTLGRDEVSDADRDDLFGGFVAFTGSLLDSLARYLDDPEARPGEDMLGYRQAMLWLDADERTELVERLRAALEPYLDNGPSGDRRRIRLSTIAIPDPQGADAET